MPQGELVYGVFREPNGRLLVYGDGHTRALDDASAARFAERRLVARCHDASRKPPGGEEPQRRYDQG